MRPLNDKEIVGLLAGDVVARVATIDAEGYPHVTPLWFVWAEDAFHLTSDVGRPHLARIRSNPRIGLVIDVEQELRADGERPNQQVRAVGDAELIADTGGAWTTRIWQKYSADGHVASERLVGLRDRERVLIRLRPQQLLAVGSV